MHRNRLIGPLCCLLLALVGCAPRSTPTLRGADLGAELGADGVVVGSITLAFAGLSRDEGALAGETQTGRRRPFTTSKGTSASEARLHRALDATTTEWWQPHPAGLEFGLDLAASPAGEGPIFVDFALLGARAQLHPSAESTRLTDRSGTTLLHVRGLLAWDATGAPLDARFVAAAPDRLRLRVEDDDAVYPITIDPVLTSMETTTLGAPAGGRLGYAVTSAGDVNDDGFDDLLVGEPYYDGVAGTDSGRASLYLGSAAGPAPTPVWTYEGDQAFARVGRVVAGLGDANGTLGDDVALGAPDHDPGGISGAGSVFVFYATGAAPWLAPAPNFTVSGTVISEECGGSIATDAPDFNGDGRGDLALACPEGHVPGNSSDPGRVDVWFGAPGGYTGAAPGFTLPGAAAEDELGSALANAGDVNGDGLHDLLVGAEDIDGLAGTDAGQVALHLGTAAGLSTAASRVFSSGQAGARLGSRVGGAGDLNGDGYADLLLGAERWDSAFVDEGRVTVHLGSPAGPSASPAFTFLGGQASAQAGGRELTTASGGTAGVFADFDGDGFDELALSAWRFDGPGADSGRVEIRGGSALGLSPYPVWTGVGSAASARFGYALASGDFDGDGDGDLVLGEWGATANDGRFRFLPGPLTDTTGAQTVTAGEAITAFSGGDRSRGLNLSMTQSARLVEIESRLAPTAPTTITFTVYESTTANGTYAQIAQRVTTAPMGGPWVRSGPTSILLTAGRHYYVSTHWVVSSAYYASVETLPAPLGTFGQITGYRTSSGPPPATVSGAPLTTILYPTRLTLHAVLDADADGSDAGPDCQDAIASNSPSGVELCDGLDDDCDGSADFGGVTWEGSSTSTLSASNTLKGNRFLASLDRVVTSVELYQESGTLGAVSLGVYSAASATGPWTLLHERAAVPTSTVAGWLVFPAVNLPLVAGTYYAFVQQWLGGSTYFWASGPTNPEWGTHVGGLSDAATTLPPSGATFSTNPSRYRMRIATSRELDDDGDGSFACLDCDDADALRFPGQAEACDGLDNNCDGLPNADPAGEVDGDGDGFRSCVDCNDASAVSFPAAPELCDGLDNDCNSAIPTNEADGDGDGVRVCGGDCDDGDATRSPIAPETCDGVDDDCDATIDESAVVTIVGGGAGSAVPPTGTLGTTFATATVLVDGPLLDVNVTLAVTHTWVDDLGITLTDPFGSTVLLANHVGGSGDNFVGTIFDDEAATAIASGAAPFTGSFRPSGLLSLLDGSRPGGTFTLTLDDDAAGDFGTLNGWSIVATIQGGLDADGDGYTGCFDCDETSAAVSPGDLEICDGLDTDCNGALGSGEVDLDGDGAYVCEGDCDDVNPARFPGNPELCDGLDNDCNGVVPAAEADADGDGIRGCAGDCNDGNATIALGAAELCDGWDNNCNGSLGPAESDGDGDFAFTCAYVATGGNPAYVGSDCNDGNASARPGLPEVCDGGVDNDCNASTVEGFDFDGDGHTSCTDCDDANAARFPGNAELCDGWDNDCNGALAATESDADGDLALACTFVLSGGNPVYLGGDCNDGNPSVRPGAPEVCDGLDNDCNGVIPTNEANGDGDGFRVCAGDCDDANASRYPGAPELCDGLDDDCNGSIPSSESDGDADGFRVCAGDCNDGSALVYPSAPELCDGLDNNCVGGVPGVELDGDSDGQAPCAGDCNDAAPTVRVGAPELCDGLDNDCNGATPANEGDGDSDGVAPCAGDCNDGAPSIFPSAPELCDGLDNDCSGSVPGGEADVDLDGVRVCGGDCNDAAPAVFPGATEVCNGVDDDCVIGTSAPGGEGDGDGDGALSCLDCDDGDGNNAPGLPELCDGADNDCLGGADFDGLGEVDGDGDGALSCLDCDDADGGNGPGLPESCDGQDNDCDGSADFDAAGEVDGDGDGALSCLDCDDDDDAVWPGAAEVCDGLDTDCLPATTAAPGEGDGDSDGAPLCADCDDAASTNFPGNVEVCDGLDNDCDGVVEAGQADADGDGVNICDGDCADGDPARFPGNVEVCDGTDNDCDATTSAGAGEGDGDGDGAPLCADCDDAVSTNFPGNVEVCDGDDNDCDANTSFVGGEADGDNDGFVACADCDDALNSVWPGAGEGCDGLDSNCDGALPLIESDADGDGVATCAGDCNDGNGSVAPGVAEACDGVDNDCDPGTNELADLDGDGASPCTGDCDDQEAAATPGNAEACDGLDTDCDPASDEDVDDDGDGLSVCAGDCDDTDAAVTPAATEVCDGQDTDCDPATNLPLPEDDTDADGSLLCDAPADCDDTDPSAYPGAPELCDGADNDCDGLYDDAIEDSDGDGFSPCEGDCDDSAQALHPNALEGCDGLDSNCDGALPEAEMDADADLSMPCQGDCDDAEPRANHLIPGEGGDACRDGLDNDCDGDADALDADCGPLGDDDDSSDDDDSGDDDDMVVDPPPDLGCACASNLGAGSAGVWAALLALGALVLRRRIG